MPTLQPENKQPGAVGWGPSGCCVAAATCAPTGCMAWTARPQSDAVDCEHCNSDAGSKPHAGAGAGPVTAVQLHPCMDTGTSESREQQAVYCVSLTARANQLGVWPDRSTSKQQPRNMAMPRFSKPTCCPHPLGAGNTARVHQSVSTRAHRSKCSLTHSCLSEAAVAALCTNMQHGTGG